jgi:type II secretory pathway pseudopilin PulG
MRMHRLTSSSGFTLIAVMALVVIMGIMAGAAVQNWQRFMKREREEELLFRGTQYMSALKRWYNPNPPKVPKGAPQPPLAATSTRPLRDLKYLLADPNTPETVRYLRRLYTDPVTGKDFVPILDASQAIVGVKSTSDLEPLKKGNFPDELQGLNDKKKYSEWEFVYRTVPLARASGSQSGLPQGPPPPPPPPQ